MMIVISYELLSNITDCIMSTSDPVETFEITHTHETIH